MLRCQASFIKLLGCCVIVLLTDCGQTQLSEVNPPLTATVKSEPSPGGFPSPTPPPTYPNVRATVETEVQLTHVARATAQALTPTLPPPTRPSITNTPEPLR